MTRTTVVPNVMYVSSAWKLAANLTQQSMKRRSKLMFMGLSVSFFVPIEADALAAFNKLDRMRFVQDFGRR